MMAARRLYCHCSVFQREQRQVNNELSQGSWSTCIAAHHPSCACFEGAQPFREFSWYTER